MQRVVIYLLLFAQANLVGSTLVFVSHDESLQALFNRSISLVDIMEQAQ